MIRHRFNFLLVTLILLVLVVPFLRYFGPAARVVFTALFFGMLVSAVLAVSERRKHLVIAGTLAVMVVVLRAVSFILHDTHEWWLSIKVVGLGVEMICFGYTTVLIVRYVLSADRVTFDMICASLCAYLLLGIVWAQLYILLTATAMQDPDSLVLTAPIFSPRLFGDGVGTHLGRIDQMYVTAMYVSFVTLSTLGYGDITPTAELTRMLTVVEAIIGQFYLAVLVARLVGLHIAGARKDSDG